MNLRFLSPFAQPNFSLFFTGRLVSNTGTWFESLALSLVVLQATGSAQAFSGVTIAQFLPMLLLSIPAGRLADRIRPRTILLCTSALSAAIVTALAFVVAADAPSLAAIYALAAASGCAMTFERVAEQTIIYELVGPGLLTQGISLGSIAGSSARSIGPGLAGLAFQGLGPMVCMLINAAAFLIAFASTLFIRPARLHRRDPERIDSARSVDRLGETRPSAGPLRGILREPGPLALLVINTVVSLFSLNFMIVLTATASLTFEADATLVGLVHSANAVGAILGSLIVAGRRRPTFRSLAPATALFGLSLLLNAAAPTLALFILAGPILGVGFAYYQGVLHSVAQSSVPPAMIGRFMALVNLGNLGVVPLGAWVAGLVTDAQGGQFMMAIGGAVALLCAFGAALMLRRR